MNSMKRILHKYILPNPMNDNKPHLLRETGVLVLTYAIVLLFFGSLLQSQLIQSPQFTAEVLPAVLIDLANDDREDNQLAYLTYNRTLETAAQLKAADMAAGQYFAHTSPYDAAKTPWYWFNAAGYAFRYAGENLAIDFSDSRAVNRAWMNSPGHRANLLNDKFTEIGVAVVQGEYQGHDTTYVVQTFGSPRNAVVAVAPTPVPNPIPTPVPQPQPQPTPVVIPPAPQPQPVPSTQNSPEASEPEVAGEEVLVQEEEPAPEPEKTLVVLAEDDKFIAVQEVQEGENPELISDPPSNSQPAQMSEAPKYSTWYERLAASPRRTLEYSYIAISGLILLVILLMVNKEIQRHHLKHICYGLLMLVLMFSLLSASKAILIGEVVVK
jgi:uncharacterized protein YkwD